MSMTSDKPYLMRAVYEWICDNSCTPYLYVDTVSSDVVIPEHLYGDNPLILNISPAACQYLSIGNDDITFKARFSGKVFDLSVPVSAVLAIIARENGLGMSFSESDKEQEQDGGNNEISTSEVKPNEKKGHLKIIR